MAPDQWPRCWELLRKVVRRFPDMTGPKTSEDVLSAIRRGETQLWLAHAHGQIEGVAITRLIKADILPEKLLCDFDYWAGENMRAWGRQMFETIKSWAKAQGCQYMTWTGRKGWLRLFGGRQIGVLSNGKPAFAIDLQE